MIQNEKVRQVLNEKMLGLATNFSEQYSDKIIRYISERIHEWDSREMIAKIESEVGGYRVLPANRELAGAEIEMVDMEAREGRLRSALQTVQDEFDFILIDAPLSS